MNTFEKVGEFSQRFQTTKRQYKMMTIQKTEFFGGRIIFLRISSIFWEDNQQHKS
jgi:hypothetical protein